MGRRLGRRSGGTTARPGRVQGDVVADHVVDEEVQPLLVRVVFLGVRVNELDHLGQRQAVVGDLGEDDQVQLVVDALRARADVRHAGDARVGAVVGVGLGQVGARALVPLLGDLHDPLAVGVLALLALDVELGLHDQPEVEIGGLVDGILLDRLLQPFLGLLILAHLVIQLAVAHQAQHVGALGHQVRLPGEHLRAGQPAAMRGLDALVELPELLRLAVVGGEGLELVHLGGGPLEVIFFLQDDRQLQPALHQPRLRLGGQPLHRLHSAQHPRVADGLLVKLGGGGEVLLLLQALGARDVRLQHEPALLPAQRLLLRDGDRVRRGGREGRGHRQPTGQAQDE
jgi:hypothetical protein